MSIEEKIPIAKVEIYDTTVDQAQKADEDISLYQIYQAQTLIHISETTIKMKI